MAATDEGRFAPGFWMQDFPVFADEDLPTFTGSTTFLKLPLAPTAEALTELRAEAAIVGAPFDDGVSHRPGARMGPRAIRAASYIAGRKFPSLQHDFIEPLSLLNVADAGDANIVPSWHERGHAMIYRKVRDVAAAGAVPIILGGDHSITWPAVSAIAEVVWPLRVGVVHFDAHADTVPSNWGQPLNLSGHGTPMRRLIESQAVRGANFIQVGLRGYWPPREIFAWMADQGMRWHLMTEIEDRGGLGPVLRDAIAEALEDAEVVYVSVDIDVVEPGLAPGTGTPEPGGLTSRELLRAVRELCGATRLAGIDIVEVAPAYDVAEVTSTLAHRVAMEAISALAARKHRGEPVGLTASQAVGRTTTPAGS
jgi:agmatinase